MRFFSFNHGTHQEKQGRPETLLRMIYVHQENRDQESSTKSLEEFLQGVGGMHLFQVIINNYMYKWFKHV